MKSPKEPVTVHSEYIPCGSEVSMTVPRYGIGQKVTFINDYGVSFPHRVITGIHFYPRPHVPVGYDLIPDDTPWFPTNEQNLFLEYNQD